MLLGNDDLRAEREVVAHKSPLTAAEADRETLVERTADANRQTHSFADLVFRVEGAKEASVFAGQSELLALNSKARIQQRVSHGVEDLGMRQRIPSRGCWW